MLRGSLVWQVLPLFSLISLSAEACLWDSSINPVFLNANPISVCINAPNDIDQEQHFAEFRETEAQVRASVRALDEQTSLSFVIQQDYCGTDAESLAQPQVRLTLDANISTGQAMVEGDFAHLQTNVLLPYLPQSRSNEENPLERREQGNTQFITQHEILHLLGIHHDDRGLEGANPDKRRSQNPEILELTENPAEVSVMNILGTELTPLLQGHNVREQMGITSEDIQCVDTVISAHQQRNTSPGIMIGGTDPESAQGTE